MGEPTLEPALDCRVRPALILGLAGFLAFPGATRACPSPDPAFAPPEGRSEARAVSDARNDHDDSDPRYLDYDLIRVQLALRLDVVESAVQGVVEHEVRANLDGVTSILFDLTDVLTVDSVTRGTTKLSFHHANRLLLVDLDRPLRMDESTVLRIAYSGVPEPDGFMGMEFGWHAPEGHRQVPLVQTLSETHAAPGWWPCKDITYDKFQISVDVTVPDWMNATSNGVLLETRDEEPGFRTFRWHESYPIATYLVAVTATDFRSWEDSYAPLGGGPPMPVVYYCFPESESVARARWARTPEMIRVFAERFGEYPFVFEKYGMVEFGWGGAMEHQTLTSYGTFALQYDPRSNERIVAHELAHQWWGDRVSPATWDDIWLNEGFATWSEALWFESQGGLDAYIAHMRTKLPPPGSEFEGSIYHPTYTFNTTVYYKGAWTLHMLRRVLGDDVLFDALRNYRRSQSSTIATTEGLRALLELYSGQDLERFFQQWVYGTGRPVYQLAWSASAADPDVALDLTLRQVQSEAPFEMPLDLVLEYADSPAETVTVATGARLQSIRLRTHAVPTRIRIDPMDWVLKRIDYVAGPSGIEEGDATSAPWSVTSFGPNPSRGPLRIVLRAGGGHPPGARAPSLRILDVAGRCIRRLSAAGTREEPTYAWDGRASGGDPAPAGTYWVIAEGAPGLPATRIVRVP